MLSDLADELSCFKTLYLHTFSFSKTSFSLLKHYLDLYIIDTSLKVSRSLYCFTTSMSHGVGNYFPRLWGTGISVAIFFYNREYILSQGSTICKISL